MMDSFDSEGFPASGSRLLSQSPQFSFASANSTVNTGPGGDDLSLSELYSDNLLPGRQVRTAHNPKTRPSIAQALGFGAPLDQSDDQSMLKEGEEGGGELDDEEGAGEADVTVTVRGSGEDADRTTIATQSREEKMQRDILLLRQLNSTFAVYNDALRQAQAATGRIAKQLEQTDVLLNKYINILSKSEQFSRLIFDERWIGAEADEALLEEEARVQEERRRREDEERKRAAHREQERREKEELERAMRDEAERLEREKRDRTAARSSSGVRGVRGTRAFMRAGATTRGVSRSVSASSTGASGHTKATSGTASKTARPSSAVSTTRGTTGIPRGVSKRP
ncbi:hypothetical protein F5148DRAFT_1220270 [Russula earlei]|uniref:Uncharacterized protein n=1 Tax=Russula earlei TaxID=71964 RepID=A0ACC0U1Y1_9AGAM|nr:hypothetical protein F5148DRAFT_1220270 [Russula earlei]